MQPVTVQKRVQGKVIKLVDRAGAVFHPIPGKASRPAYSYGPAGDTTRDVMFTCPVSAIPEAVWSLLIAWWKCRQMGLPFRAGGAEDQPGIVQYAFPIFESEMKAIEVRRGGPERAAALAVGAMVKVMSGGKGK